MSVTKQGKSKAWSLASPQLAPPVTVPVIWPFILHAATLTHHKALKKKLILRIPCWNLKPTST